MTSVQQKPKSTAGSQSHFLYKKSKENRNKENCRKNAGTLVLRLNSMCVNRNGCHKFVAAVSEKEQQRNCHNACEFVIRQRIASFFCSFYSCHQSKHEKVNKRKVSKINA